MLDNLFFLALSTDFSSAVSLLSHMKSSYHGVGCGGTGDKRDTEIICDLSQWCKNIVHLTI